MEGARGREMKRWRKERKRERKEMREIEVDGCIFLAGLHIDVGRSLFSIYTIHMPLHASILVLQLWSRDQSEAIPVTGNYISREQGSCCV